MHEIHVYQVEAGWFWEVRLDERVVLFGLCQTRERAELKARLS